MGESIHVLVVDDAVTVRTILSELLVEDPSITQVTAVRSGSDALKKLPELTPDIVVLDFEMPGMSGLETLSQIRKLSPNLPVIMFSALTERGALETLDALAKGANDYVTKPTGSTSGEGALQQVKDQLLPKIKLFCGTSRGRKIPVGAHKGASSPQTIPAKPRAFKGPQVAHPVRAIAIGVSTGGPEALNAFLPSLPADLQIPIFIVQHMPPTFTRLLAERLNAATPLAVYEATDGLQVSPGTIYIAPGDYHMVVNATRNHYTVALNQDPPEHSCRPAVDVLFRSVASVYGPGLLGVVLTGMGNDGTIGCERIRKEGGTIFVQDEETSVVWGMAGSVARSGFADAVVPLQRMAQEIVQRVYTTQARVHRG